MSKKAKSKTQKQLDTLLYEAVHENDIASARSLIEKGADPKWCYVRKLEKGDINPDESLLSIALDNQNTEMMRLLIKHGADTKFKLVSGIVSLEEGKITVQYETLLQRASKIADPKFAEILIKNGAQIDDEKGQGANGTALFEAVSNGNLKTASVLLENGAHPNAPALPTTDFLKGRFDTRRIPLGEAVRRGDYDMTYLLLQHGAAEYIDEDAHKALIQLAANGTNKKLESLLLETPEDLNQAFQLIQFRNPDWAEHLINNGHDIGCPVDIGKHQETSFLGIEQIPVKLSNSTPLARAIKGKHYNLARLMIKKGTNLNLDDLTYLLKSKDFDIFKRIIRGNSAILKKHGAEFLKVVQSVIHPPYEREADPKALLFYKSLKYKIDHLNKKMEQKEPPQSTVKYKKVKIRD